MDSVDFGQTSGPQIFVISRSLHMSPLASASFMDRAQPHTGDKPISAVAGPSSVRRIGAASRRAAAALLEELLAALPSYRPVELSTPAPGTIGQEIFCRRPIVGLGKRLPANEPMDEHKEGAWRQV